jgi:hypothetical protein
MNPTGTRGSYPAHVTQPRTRHQFHAVQPLAEGAFIVMRGELLLFSHNNKAIACDHAVALSQHGQSTEVLTMVEDATLRLCRWAGVARYHNGRRVDILTATAGA